MGVRGLWEVVAPVAKPVNLDVMAGQRLAVDASIWIYHFLKAMRDSEGKVIRHAHVVGFLRRICKLIYFGIQPVFVFDGGAPALKRSTIANRKERSRNRLETAQATAAKILTLQLHKHAMNMKKNAKKDKGKTVSSKDDKLLNDDDTEVAYLDEVSLDKSKRTNVNKESKVEEMKRKTLSDPYFLPEVTQDDINRQMMELNDPRMLTQDELDTYADEFQSQIAALKTDLRNNNEDSVSGLYDEKVMDFESAEFKALPITTQYQLLSAARLRSRLRMGYTIDQLENKFADKYEFSKFQIERVRQRNYLTQKLMNFSEEDAKGIDSKVSGGGNTRTLTRRVAGQRDREYVLQRNDQGWTLALEDERISSNVIAIDVDDTEIRDSELQFQNKEKLRVESNKVSEDDDDYDSDEIEWEDVVVKSPKEEEDYIDHQLEEVQDSKEEDLSKEHEVNTKTDNPFIIEESESDNEQDDSNFSNNDNQAESTVSVQSGDININSLKPLSFKNSLFSKSTQKPSLLSKYSQSAPPKKQPENTIKKHTDKPVETLVKEPVKEPSQESTEETAKKPSFDKDLPVWFQNSSVKTSKSDHEANNKNISNPQEREVLDMGESSFFRRPLKPLDPLIYSSTSSSEEDEEGSVELDDEFIPYEELQRRRQRAVYQVENDYDDDEDEIQIVKETTKDDGDDDIIIVSETSTSKPTAEAEAPIPASFKYAETQKLDIDMTKNLKKSANQELANQDTPVVSPSTSTLKSLYDGKTPTSDTPTKSAQKNNAAQHKESPKNNETPTKSKESAASQYTKEHLEELAKQEEEYQKQEDEDMLEQYQAEIEETKEYLDQNDTSSLPTTPTGTNKKKATFYHKPMSHYSSSSTTSFSNSSRAYPSESSPAQRLQDMPDLYSPTNSSLDADIAQLRRQKNKEMRDADQVTPEMIAECQELLKRFGIPFITAPMEAEAQCAELQTLKLVDGIITDDADVFLFGDNVRVFKNMFASLAGVGNGPSSGKKSQVIKYVECYDSADIRNELGLDRKKLIKLAYLLGSDYTEGVTGIGPVSAMEILANFDTNEKENGLIKFKNWWKQVQLKRSTTTSGNNEAAAETEFERKFRKLNTTKIFLPTDFPNKEVEKAYLEPEVDKDKTPFEWGTPDLDSLRKLCKSLLGWNEYKTDELLVPVIKMMNQRKTQSNARQTELKDFFMFPERDIARKSTDGTARIAQNGKVTRSKRLNKAINVMSSRMKNNSASRQNSKDKDDSNKTRQEATETNQQQIQEEEDLYEQEGGFMETQRPQIKRRKLNKK